MKSAVPGGESVKDGVTQVKMPAPQVAATLRSRQWWGCSVQSDVTSGWRGVVDKLGEQLSLTETAELLVVDPLD